MAALLGYRLPDNFNFPYISRSFSEFWTRWHISLSSFLKEYLYISLGGNRKGRFRTYLNLMIVMFLGGVWHGATWNFAIWGLCHGAFLSVERVLKGRVRLPDTKLVKVFQTMLVFTFVNFAWLIFRTPDFSHVIKYFHAIFNNTGLTNENLIIGILAYSSPVILYHFYHLLARGGFLNGPMFARLNYIMYGTMLLLIITNSGSPESFVYFQF